MVGPGRTPALDTRRGLEGGQLLARAATTALQRRCPAATSTGWGGSARDGRRQPITPSQQRTGRGGQDRAVAGHLISHLLVPHVSGWARVVRPPEVAPGKVDICWWPCCRPVTVDRQLVDDDRAIDHLQVSRVEAPEAGGHLITPRLQAVFWLHRLRPDPPSGGAQLLSLHPGGCDQRIQRRLLRLTGAHVDPRSHRQRRGSSRSGYAQWCGCACNR